MHLKDDCFQAACLGLLKAHEKKDRVTFFKSYAYRCMQSEVIKEIARLHDPLPLDPTTFLLLCKYKKYKGTGKDLSELSLSSGRLNDLKILSASKRVPYKEHRNTEE